MSMDGDVAPGRKKRICVVFPSRHYGASPEEQQLRRYIEVDAREAMKRAHEGLLTSEIIDEMRKALSGLREAAQ